MISGFSVLSALIFYSAALLVICMMRWHTGFLENGGTSVLLLASTFAAFRLLLPFEMPVTFAIQSWNLLGVPLKFFRTYPVVTRFLLVGWAIGAVVVMGRDVADLYRAHVQCRDYTIVENELVQEIAKRRSITCPVVVSPDVEVPYVAGIFRYNIYVPAVELPEKDFEFILAHEAQHIRSHDALIKLFFGLMSVVMWWNPIAHWSRREIDALLELRCDARVTKGMSVEERCAYAKMLKDMAKRVVAGRRMPVLALDESMAVGRPNLLRQRLQVITSRKNKPLRLMSIVVLAAVFCLSYLVVAQSAIAPSEKSFVDESEVYYKEDYSGSTFGEGRGPGSTFIMKDADGRYQLCINYEFSRYLTEDEVVSDQYKEIIIVFEEEGQE